jgi:hypothetical protein
VSKPWKHDHSTANTATLGGIGAVFPDCQPHRAAARAYYKFGAIFENLILAERLKHGHHTGYPPRLYFYRDSNQTELALF